MSDLIEAKKCFRFISFLFSNEHSTDFIYQLFFDKFGKGICLNSPFFPMKNFYSKEMGEENNLKRILILSDKLIDRTELVADKIWSKNLENNFALMNKRSINIDPGYLSLENVVLSTGKQFTHRIYLSHGVYADLNLVYEHNSFRSLPWTYPDYAHTDFIKFFNWNRALLLKNLNNT
jgi:hypothetical protein